MPGRPASAGAAGRGFDGYDEKGGFGGNDRFAADGRRDPYKSGPTRGASARRDEDDFGFEDRERRAGTGGEYSQKRQNQKGPSSGMDDLGFDDDDLFGGDLGAAAWDKGDDTPTVRFELHGFSFELTGSSRSVFTFP